jgi:2-(1,2-epoxy-1,2-dihydrophenyl)acetyl-CoA isomerase
LALDEIENADNGVRALIVTGSGRGFCAGANVARMDGGAENAQKNRPSDAGEGLEKVYHPLLRRFRNLHCPIISAVNGPCAGVGMSFALMGDMIVANESAFFLQAFRRIGLVPDGGATYLLWASACRQKLHWNGGLSTALWLMINCSTKPVHWPLNWHKDHIR